MMTWIQVAVFTACAIGIILYSLPPDIGGPPL